MNNYPNFTLLQGRRPQAWARISGRAEDCAIAGNLRFYRYGEAVVVAVELSGLPRGVYRLRFAETEGETREEKLDFPPLLSVAGIAYLAFLTDRFDVEAIEGKELVLCEEEGRRVAEGNVKK